MSHEPSSPPDTYFATAFETLCAPLVAGERRGLDRVIAVVIVGMMRVLGAYLDVLAERMRDGTLVAPGASKREADVATTGVPSGERPKPARCPRSGSSRTARYPQPGPLPSRGREKKVAVSSPSVARFRRGLERAGFRDSSSMRAAPNRNIGFFDGLPYQTSLVHFVTNS